ncbi:putative mitochondrial protein, conserved [Ascosphaera atra]|nr:putative mitochondrial protein, conserved [Ascosphaera atra]
MAFLRHFASISRPTSSLDKEEQAIFEELQRRSTGAFSTPRPDPSEVQASTGKDLKIDERTGDVLHPDTPRKAAPEFEGDVNPKTGEVGGPKNEPLRWGAEGDWSFNGRATDF